MLSLLSLSLLLLPLSARCQDSVAAAVGPHALGRIAELLSGPECRQLRQELDSAEEEEEPGLPGEENSAPPEEEKKKEEEEEEDEDEEGSVPLRRRSTRSARGCSESLLLWLRSAGEGTTWDRLVRALQRLGRSDIARELGKNLNQDRSLELSRNARFLSSAQLRPRGRRDALGPGGVPRVVPRAPLSGEMLFERHRPARFGRGLLGWLRPVLLGVLGAFITSVLLTATAMYFCHWRRLLGA